ncbi:hypothetical protein GOV05_03095 [Candidatus Woesearchaeota archaeon]|nr:hypothetical protein [Candidatus Woesearchaeota archaeon]
MRHISVDQSGKVEATSVDTVLALNSTDIQYSILIPKKIKQEIFGRCKKQYKKKIMIKTFSYSLYLLLKKKVQKNSIIVIDDEYPKHGKNIKNYLATKLKFDAHQITIGNIGKKDEAHRIAYDTYRKKIKPNEVITSKQLNLNKLFSRKDLEKILKKEGC